MQQTDKRNIQTLLEIMATLRDPRRGCPWDREQDFGSIAPYTIEEAYEVADAIDRDDLPDLCDELGDLLLQVVFHAQMAREIGAFDFGDVVAAISNKMLRRHPHVFGTESVANAEAQRVSWERLKAAERAERGADLSALAGVSLSLPALTRAGKLGKRAANVGFDWENAAGVAAKIQEELQEVIDAGKAGQPEQIAEEIGDLLFACTNLARHYSVDPEQALRNASRKFERRFRHVEARVRDSDQGWQTLTPADLERLWLAAKSQD